MYSEYVRFSMLLRLNLKNINLHSPYMVGQTDENKSSFYFTTDFGLKYTISFSQLCSHEKIIRDLRLNIRARDAVMYASFF